MARPQNLQELRHGKLLTENNFPAFVDTFNYVVRRLDNLVGDRDTNPQTGTIRVDNTDPEHPVIRCDKPILSSEGGVVNGDSDLSGVGLSSVHVADLSGTQYVQLYKFDEEPTEQTGAKIDNTQGAFEIGSGDWFLVKNGDELHYKKIVLSTDLSGGGGGGSISVDSDIASLNSNSLEHVNSGGNDYYELYGFHDLTNTQTQLSDYEFVVRHRGSNATEVAYLSSMPTSTCGAFAYDASTHTIKDGMYLRARRWVEVASATVTAAGYAYL